MGYTFLLLFIWANALVSSSVAALLSQTIVQSASESVVEAPVPSSSLALTKVMRKLGRHHYERVMSSATTYLSPSGPPNNQDKLVHSADTANSPTQSSSVDQKSEQFLSISERHVILAKNNHHILFDKSIAGGGVILGGLATVFMVAVLCYIRATGRNKGQTTATVATT